MTKSTVARRNRDVSDYLRQTSISDTQPAATADTSGSKTPAEAAMLAQELASESSWAERYVPSTPADSVMTPSASSVAGNTEAPFRSMSVAGESDYITADDAPPTYELATSEADVRSPEDNPQVSGSQTRAPQLQTSLQPSSQAQLEQPGSQRTSAQRPFIPGRRYSRHETSNAISGTFTLWDSLDLSTTSGSISITLDVKPGPHPATLKLKAQSGSIRVDDLQCRTAQSNSRGGTGSCSRQERGPGLLSSLFGWGKRPAEVEAPPRPVSDDPRKQAGQHEQQAQALPTAEIVEEQFEARVIHAMIETSSGSVNAHLVLTARSDTRINVGSGSINLRLVTSGSGVGDQQFSKLEMEDSRNADLASTTDLSSNLSTQSGSGSTTVTINSGNTDTSDGAIVSACRASYRVTKSGSCNVHYPGDWVGLAHASCGGSGSARVSGSGLEYDKRGNYEVYAWRGVDEPDLSKAVEIRCDGSGSISFSC